MGYTHYWRQSRDFTREQWAELSTDIAAILKDVQHVQGIPLANGMGEPATSPEFTADRIAFNGAGEAGAYETFDIDRVRSPKESWQTRRGNGFCKTSQRPYDVAVTAVLCYLATVAESHVVSSDGDGRDWLAGLEEARRALPRWGNTLDIPRPILEDDRWCPPHVSHRTDAYRFRFCVDGKAYVIRERDGASYCFPTHRDAAEFAHKHREVLDATGYFDQKRMRSLKAQQDALLRGLIEAAPIVGRDQAPPAFVRPNEIPEPAKRAYTFAELLESCHAQAC